MKSILLLFTLCLLPKWADAQQLHLIMATDYADPTFGKNTLENEDAIEKMFGSISKKLDYGINKIYLNTTNKLFNYANITSSLDNLKTNPEDIIVFYYTGYGTFSENPNSNFPSFKLADNPLAMDDVAKKLREKQGRLVMVIADIRDTNNKLIDFTRRLNKEEDFSKIITQKIFLEPVGVYKIASTKKNMPAYPYFTIAFSDKYYEAIETTDTDLIPPITMNFVLKNTQSQLNAMIKQSEIKNPQQIMVSFEKLERLVKTYSASTFAIPSPKELKTQIELLANSVVEEERKKAAEMLRNFFTPNATIEVRTENKNINVQNNEVIKLSVENYIKQTEKYDKTMKRAISFEVGDFSRNEDFKKFISLKIVERIK